jgi:hypothetical protein
MSRVEYNVQRAINTLSASVDKYALDSTNKIAGTARRIDAWRLDVLQALESVRDEIALLLSSKQKLQKAQTALGVIRSISVECLERRSFRLAVDLTLDPGQVELVKVRITTVRLLHSLVALSCFVSQSRGQA